MVSPQSKSLPPEAKTSNEKISEKVVPKQVIFTDSNIF